MDIKLPTKKGVVTQTIFSDTQHLCVVGANGSGKTRFAFQLQKLNPKSIIVTAQKFLQVPNNQTIKDLETSNTELNKGFYSNGPHSHSLLARVTPVDVINDYEKLLDVLFSEEASQSIKFKHQGGGVPPVSKLDKLKQLWERLLPHKKLQFENLRLEISEYSGREGSDGERLIFYIIGKVLTVAENSIIIIDEPENNLHKAILKSLYDALEKERSDCSFVYISHDIDFAVSRNDCTNIWIKEYCRQGTTSWDYEILESDTPIPEHLYLEVLGSRNPIIFIEGDQSSLDYKLYQKIFPDNTVKPVDSCQSVIDSAMSLNRQNEFHRLSAMGIVDRDRRKDQDVHNLRDMGIWVLDVAEVENIFLVEGVVKAVQNHLNIDEDLFSTVKENVIKYFEEQLDAQIHVHLKDELSKRFRSLQNIQEIDITTYKQQLDQLYAGVDVVQIHSDLKTKFESAISQNDYVSVLKYFNEKKKNSIIARSGVHTLLGMGKPLHYIETVLRLVDSDKAVSRDIKTAVKSLILQ